MNQFLSDLGREFLGEPSAAFYLAAILWAAIGGFISLRLHANSRSEDSLNTPIRFSWAFLLKDNLQRLINGFLLTFTTIRFSVEILGIDTTMYIAFLIGLLSDRLAGLFAKLELNARK